MDETGFARQWHDNATGVSQLNPSLPSSVGALLAEEWTIDPSSTLPSFLERMMMEEVRRSVWDTMRSILSALEGRLSLAIATGGNSNESNPSVRRVEGIFAFRSLREWRLRFAKTLLQNVLRPFGPELRFLIFYALERGSLVYTQATFSESLYGGKRVKLGDDTSKGEGRSRRSLRPMEGSDSSRLAFFMALGPYLEERSDFFIAQLLRWSSLLAHSGKCSWKATNHKRLTVALKVALPLLKLTAKGRCLWFKWQYLLGKSVFFDPYSSWLNLIVRRVTLQDSEPTTTGTVREDDSVNRGRTLQMHSILKRLTERVGFEKVRWATSGVVSSMVAIAWIARIRSIRQELQRERELEELRQTQLRGSHEQRGNAGNEYDYRFIKTAPKRRMPPPPNPPPSVHMNSKFSCRNPNLCPLCNEPRINPTASSSGYVFCLKCIVMFVREHRSMCPITGKPCTESNLVRLYEPIKRMS